MGDKVAPIDLGVVKEIDAFSVEGDFAGIISASSPATIFHIETYKEKKVLYVRLQNGKVGTVESWVVKNLQ